MHESAPRLDQPISLYLSAPPYSVQAVSTLRHALDTMAAYGIRHLPVLQDGRVAGLVRESELSLLEAYDPDGFEALPVSAAMTLDLLLVAPSTPLDTVLYAMDERRHDHAIVLERKELVGIFTVTDALRLLREGAPRAAEGRTACVTPKSAPRLARGAP